MTNLELAILEIEMLYNPYPLPEEPTSEPKQLNLKYILEYYNEYSYESAPETVYYEWIRLYECDDAIILEMVMEPYMRIIERTTGNIVMLHDIQREIINIEEIEEGENN